MAAGDEDVFIEIDPDALAFSDAVGATLCHEICHKWLQVMGISSPIEMENEILTDITTVFLGFGKIMLNGCYVKNVSTQQLSGGKDTRTATYRCGYLNRDQMAFAYGLVCAMRKISYSESVSDLNADAVKSICESERLLGRYYREQFHQREPIEEAVSAFQTEKLLQQRQLAELNKHLIYVSESFCSTLKDFLASSHTAGETLSKKARLLSEERNNDPALSFLRAIRREHEVERMSEDLAANGVRIRAFLGRSAAVGRHLWKNSDLFPRPSVAMFTMVSCPVDGTRLRLPANSPELIVKCSTCHYRFSYNTACPSFENPLPKHQCETTSRPRRFWRWRRKKTTT